MDGRILCRKKSSFSFQALFYLPRQPLNALLNKEIQLSDCDSVT